MVSKRKSIHQNQSHLNFRPNLSENQKQDAKGSKPLPDPASVANVLLMMVLHGCRKLIFFDTKIRVAIYLSCLFIISLLADTLPFPKTYFSSKNNVFNVYFVKLAWGWTLFLTLPFVYCTSFTICCGKRHLVIKNFIRLAVATTNWFFWVNLFEIIESTYGKCNVKGEKYQTKPSCLKGGHFWHGFDLSGHSFILVYSCLTIIEEARAVIGWEGIRDMIRNEVHNRVSPENNFATTALKGLSADDLNLMKISYEKFTPFVRFLFVSMTLITLLWDFMLLITILYFHNTVEKFLSGVIAVALWFVTYQMFYPKKGYFPGMPGDGMFKYRDNKQNRNIPLKKKSNIPQKGDLPRFMGMPLIGLRNQEKSEERNSTNGLDNELAN